MNAVYLHKGWSCVYTILHVYIAIQGVPVGTVFNGLLAEIPAILDSFFHQYHKYTFYRGGGWGLGMATGTQKLYSDAGGPK